MFSLVLHALGSNFMRIWSILFFETACTASLCVVFLVVWLIQYKFSTFILLLIVEMDLPVENFDLFDSLNSVIILFF